MAQYLLFDGALNVTFLGLQAYIWIMLAFIIILAASEAIWQFFFWLPLKPVQGHFTAHTRKNNSAFVFNENLIFNMVSEKFAKLIFDMKVSEAKELQKDWDFAPSGLIGRVLSDLVFDGGGWTNLKSPVRADIENVAAMYNDMNPDDQVMTLGKFHRHLTAGKFNGIQGVENIKPTMTVDWVRIDMAIPPDHDPHLWDGWLGQHAHKKDEEINAPNWTIAYAILGLTGLIVVLMLVKWVLA